MNGLTSKERKCMNMSNLYLGMYTHWRELGDPGSTLPDPTLDATTVKITNTKLNFSMHRTQLGDENKSDFFAKCRKNVIPLK